MPGSPITTRFAPSPTGRLHVGGARTALFNWLLARASQGCFRIRIEDTDRLRHQPEAESDILENLAWLGLDWDGDIVRQSHRRDRHLEIALGLEASGKAYRCFATEAEISLARQRAKESGSPVLFNSPWRNASADAWPEEPYTLRLKTPNSGRIEIDDAVHGVVGWNCATLEDLVLIRSDGSPTYNLSVVVDDHDMAVSHIVRGDDHLANAAKQSLIYEAMGWRVPVFSHVPLIHDANGKKLSKRDGAAGLSEYRNDGILPQAVRNYLARLGWGHLDSDFMTTQEVLEVFSLNGLRRSPARLDESKLRNLSARHIAACQDEDLLEAVAAYMLEQGDAPPKGETGKRLLDALPFLKTRARTLKDLIDQARFLLARSETLSAEARPLIGESDRSILQDLMPSLAAATWQRDDLEQLVRQAASDLGLKFGAVAAPLRAALTGRKDSPSVLDIMIVIGREETLLRLRRAAQFTGTA